MVSSRFKTGLFLCILIGIVFAGIFTVSVAESAPTANEVSYVQATSATRVINRGRLRNRPRALALTSTPSRTPLPPDFTPTITPIPTITSTPEVCTVAPAIRLSPDAWAFRANPGLQVAIREQPGVNSPLVGRITTDDGVYIVQGPRCVGGYQWWNVQYNGMAGWAAEGSSAGYFLVPLVSVKGDHSVLEFTRENTEYWCVTARLNVGESHIYTVGMAFRQEGAAVVWGDTFTPSVIFLDELDGSASIGESDAEANRAAVQITSTFIEQDYTLMVEPLGGSGIYRMLLMVGEIPIDAFMGTFEYTCGGD